MEIRPLKAVRIKEVQRLKPSNTKLAPQKAVDQMNDLHTIFSFPSKEKKTLACSLSRVGVKKHQFNTKADFYGLITTNSFIYFPFSLMKINS